MVRNFQRGLIALPSVSQNGDGFSLKGRAEMFREVLICDPCATGGILLPPPQSKSQSMQLTGLTDTLMSSVVFR